MACQLWKWGMVCVIVCRSYLFRQGMLVVIFDRISRNVKLQPKVFVSGRKLFLKTLIHYRVEQELSTDRWGFQRIGVFFQIACLITFFKTMQHISLFFASLLTSFTEFWPRTTFFVNRDPSRNWKGFRVKKSLPDTKTEMHPFLSIPGEEEGDF